MKLQINFFKKKKKPIFDDRYQYSEKYIFFWNPVTKKIQGIYGWPDNDSILLYKTSDICWKISKKSHV